ncbi:MAG: hypothetical protein ACRELA_01200 [Candidatus Rokuibacteriota bacterium]
MSSTLDEAVLTIDVDWAPDPAIRFVAEHLIARGVRATWFITHRSPAIDELERHPELFELGVHPNLLPGSTHGHDVESVLSHCMELVPGARSMRTHGFMQWTGLLHHVLTRTPIAVDLSVLLPRAPLVSPARFEWRGRGLLRIPCFWTDDYEMETTRPGWALAPLLASTRGLKVFDFHPIHIYLNSSTLEGYQTVKRRVSRLPEARETDLLSFVQAGAGTRAFFLEVVDHLEVRGPALHIRDIHARCG